MGIINQLDFQVANLIAAGEVVDRPASAVKELVENSIDAGATEIIVEIKHGGITFIRVTDNGSGMSREDLPVSLKRHATSKISQASDLDSITTLGFRGEALAAISSVSKIRIMTRRRSDEAGSILVSEFGKVTDIGEMGGRPGTTVIVEELFSNVPARRKFLKRDATEALAVASAVEKQALSRPDVSITFISDSVQKFKTPGDGKIVSVLHAVFGRDFVSKLADVRSVTEGIEVNGYIGLPENVRANRNFQIFFINGRYIKSRTVTAALEQAFDSYLESSRFPCAVLYIYIHPAFVDVNVHPTKLEVKFSNERSIFDAVYCAVKNALAEHRRDGETDIMLQPKHVGGEKYDAVNAFVPVYDRIVSGGKPKTEQASIFDNAVYGEKIETAETLAGLNADKKDAETPKTPFWDISFGGDTAPTPSVPLYENAPKAEEKKYLFSISDVTETQVTSREEKKYKILGVAFNAYIFVENEGNVMVIDKHAAHERILFEDMKKILYASESHSQTLLVPESVSLSNEELGAVNEYENEIKSLGFEFETDGKEMLIRSIPTVISPSDAKDMIVTIAGQIASGTGSESVTRNIAFEKALYQASCKAAMKAGIVDNDANTKFIVDRLFEIPDIKYCPHGRPCTFELSELELEKRFKRT